MSKYIEDIYNVFINQITIFVTCDHLWLNFNLIVIFRYQQFKYFDKYLSEMEGERKKKRLSTNCNLTNQMKWMLK
jgi:hypothetical protein